MADIRIADRQIRRKTKITNDGKKEITRVIELENEGMTDETKKEIKQRKKGRCKGKNRKVDRRKQRNKCTCMKK